MLPTMYLKNEVGPDHVSVTFVNLLNDPVQLTIHAPVGSFKLYTEYHESGHTCPGNK